MAADAQRALNGPLNRPVDNPLKSPSDGAQEMARDVPGLLEQVLAAAEAHGRHDQAERLSAVHERLARPPRHVVVVGEFKKGKSSLVNALLNVRLCPTDADVATAVPSYVRYGDRLEVRALADNSSPLGQREGVQVGIADAAVAASGGRPDTCALDVRVPRDLLRDGLVLVDTPGVGGGLSSTHAAAALRALRSAGSVALVVSDASAEYSAAELEFLGAVVVECPRVLCALTKVDLYPGWRRIAAADRAHLDRLGVAVDVLPVSSVLRRAGLEEDDDDLLVESGFPELTARLVAATQETARPLLTEAAAAARSVTAQLLTGAAARRSVLAGQTDATTVGAAWEADERLAAELRGAGARWQQVLADRMGDLQAEIDVDLVTRVRRLRKEAVAKVAELPPQRMAADLGPWLQRRTNEELLDHVRTVRHEAEQVADAVAEQFGSAARRMRAGVSVEVDSGLGDAATLVAFDAGAAGSAAAEPGMAALRGGATGAVVANAVGLALSATMPVVIPVTVALSAVLASKSWRSARAGQERQLRTDLERAVVAYLDDVDVLARKDSRACVRRLQRYLREAFAARGAELHETARRTVEELRAAAAAAQEDRRTQLVELDREVDRLRGLHARAGRAVAAGLAT